LEGSFLKNHQWRTHQHQPVAEEVSEEDLEAEVAAGVEVVDVAEVVAVELRMVTRSGFLSLNLAVL